MTSNMSSTSSSSTSTQTVVQMPAVLRLTLKRDIDEKTKKLEELHKNKAELERNKAKLEAKVNGLGKQLGSEGSSSSSSSSSSISSSSSSSSTSSTSAAPLVDLSVSVLGLDDDFSDFIFIEDTSEEDKEDVFYDCEDNQDQLQTVQAQLSTYNNELQVVESQLEEEKQLTTLQSFLQSGWEHLQQIFVAENTTLASALVTGAVAVTGGGGLLALGAGAISLNELLKILIRHVNDVGANDHLQAIDNALKEIESKRAKALECTERALNLLQDVDASIVTVSIEIETLTASLSKADLEIAEVTDNAIANLRKSNGILLQQRQYLQTAINSSSQALTILELQAGELDALKSKEYVITNATELRQIIDEINGSIATVLVQSKEAYGFQLESNSNMLSALGLITESFKLNTLSYQLIGKIRFIQARLKAAQANIEQLEDGAARAIVTTGQIRQELKKQQMLLAQQQQANEVAQDQLNQQKQENNPMQESTIQGAAGAMATGAVTGLAVAGPPGAVVGGIVGFVTLTRFAARSVHYARKALRAEQTVQNKIMMTKLKKALATRSVKPGDRVSVNADFGPSQGAFFGSYTGKKIFNVGVRAINSIARKNLISQLKSAHTGHVECQIGNIRFALSFDTHNTNFNGFGAISVANQQILNEILTTALENQLMTPLQVTNLLRQLESVTIDGQNIVMIRSISKVFTILKGTCEEMIKAQTKT